MGGGGEREREARGCGQGYFLFLKVKSCAICAFYIIKPDLLGLVKIDLFMDFWVCLTQLRPAATLLFFGATEIGKVSLHCAHNNYTLLKELPPHLCRGRNSKILHEQQDIELPLTIDCGWDSTHLQLDQPIVGAFSYSLKPKDTFRFLLFLTSFNSSPSTVFCNVNFSYNNSFQS